jgi:MFS superfamily sulfate permease-like transporter
MDLRSYNLEGIAFEGIQLWEGSFSDYLMNLVHFFTPGAFIIWIISMGILLLWDNPFFKSRPIFHWIQGSLVVVVTGAIIGWIFEMFPSLALAKALFVSVPVAESASQFFQFFSLPDPGALADKHIYTLAATMALIGSLETLLCVEAADKLDPQRRFTPANLELKAQGIGNIVSGLIGGLPITQVIVRSSANIQAGGKTKMAAIIHGLLLLFAAVTIPKLLNLIPFASLAAILMMVGYKLAKPIIFKEVLDQGHYQFAPFMITIVAIVFSNLLVGVALGFVTSAFFILLENFKATLIFCRDDEAKKIVIRLSEHLSFLNKANILTALNELPHDYHVVIDGSHCSHIDYDVFEIFENFKIETESMGITLELIGITKDKTV